MSVLTRLSSKLLVVGVVASLAGCDRGSPAYNRIKDLPYSQWDSYAATLPIEQRLDLNNEIRERSGHNPDMTIEASFSSEPYETYRALVKRLQSGDDNRYYLGVIYVIDESNNFKICDQPDRKILQKYLAGITSYPDHEKYRPNFYIC